MRLRTDERWINSLICCYRPQAQCTGEMSKRRKRKHEKKKRVGVGEGKTEGEKREREDERTCWGGGDGGIEVEDKHANKKRRQITPVVCVHVLVCTQAGLISAYSCIVCFPSLSVLPFFLHGPHLSAFFPSSFSPPPVSLLAPFQHRVPLRLLPASR